MDVPAPLDDEHLNLSLIRAGWMTVLDRTDQQAAECVSHAVGFDGGKHFPHASPEIVRPDSVHGREWAQRLQPATARRAVYWLLDRHGDGEPLIDPASDAPVLRRTDGTFIVAVPQRLPTTESLTEVVLDEPVWIRTADGTLHLAPRNEYYGLSWGYGGSGPGSLALLIHRLRDDITAPGADSTSGAPQGLDNLTEHDWPTGTVLTL